MIDPLGADLAVIRHNVERLTVLELDELCAFGRSPGDVTEADHAAIGRMADRLRSQGTVSSHASPLPSPGAGA